MPTPSFIQALWREAGMLKRALLFGAPAAVVVAILVGVVLFAVSGGDDGEEAEAIAEPTSVPPTATFAPPTPSNDQVLAFLVAIAPTATPVPRATTGGASSGGGGTTSGGGGGGGAAPAPSGPRPVLTGPGPILGTDMSMSIPAIGVNGTVYSRTVGTNGKMGDPSGPWQIIWYDFSTWGGLGGYPGVPGANAVFAGHVDYIRVGPAVFYSIRNLVAGDLITVNTSNGPINYSVQWSAWAGPNEDFTQYVESTGAETVTIVTCIGSFSGGHYSNRLIVRAIRV